MGLFRLLYIAGHQRPVKIDELAFYQSKGRVDGSLDEAVALRGFYGVKKLRSPRNVMNCPENQKQLTPRQLHPENLYIFYLAFL